MRETDFRSVTLQLLPLAFLAVPLDHFVPFLFFLPLTQIYSTPFGSIREEKPKKKEKKSYLSTIRCNQARIVVRVYDE